MTYFDLLSQLRRMTCSFVRSFWAFRLCKRSKVVAIEAQRCLLIDAVWSFASVSLRYQISVIAGCWHVIDLHLAWNCQWLVYLRPVALWCLFDDLGKKLPSALQTLTRLLKLPPEKDTPKIFWWSHSCVNHRTKLKTRSINLLWIRGNFLAPLQGATSDVSMWRGLICKG